MKIIKAHPHSSTSISEFMSTKLITLHPKDKMERVKDVFDSYDIHHIPVVSKKSLLGILSLGDLLFQTGLDIQKKHSVIPLLLHPSVLVEDLMTSNPLYLSSKHTLQDVIDLMIKKRINAIPIVDNAELVGIVTSFDIIKLLNNKN